jgi:hypothetical protein
MDPKSKLGTSDSQPTQTLTSSSRILEYEMYQNTPHEEHQGLSYSSNPTTHRHLSPDCNNNADADADAFEFDITLDGISSFEKIEHMILSDDILNFIIMGIEKHDHNMKNPHLFRILRCT